MTIDDERMATNALHAAECWLQRVGAEASAAAVVTIAPAAAVGVWVPGAAVVGQLPGIDDAGAELCEATAPFVRQALAQLELGPALGALARCRPGGGARLQVVLAPARREIALRVVDGGQRLLLASLHLVDELH